MQLLSQAPESRFDLFIRHVRTDAKHLIEFAHEKLSPSGQDVVIGCTRYWSEQPSAILSEQLDLGCA
jgi:hypothetical protein